MDPKQIRSDQTAGARAPYEPPAIEESAAFERLALMCAMTSEQQMGVPPACLPIAAANSSP